MELAQQLLRRLILGASERDRHEQRFDDRILFRIRKQIPMGSMVRPSEEIIGCEGLPERVSSAISAWIASLQIQRRSAAFICHLGVAIDK